jgi:hypothetical protein
MYIGNDLRYGRSEVYYFTATSGGETSIATASDGRAIRYTVGFCTVYLNGIRLHDTDITVTSGTSVAFTSALSLNDVVTVEATHPLSIANAVPISGGSFTGAVTDGEMATFSKLIQNPDTIAGSITIASGYSAVGGSVNFTGTVAINGNLSIV